MTRLIALSAGLLALSVLAVDASAQSATPGPPPADPSDNDATALAKKLQNPIGDLYSFPFQNNTNFSTGPNKGTQDILNIQPVIPIHINEDWNVITRTILPLIWQPSLQPAQTVPFGTGPTTFSAFLSPSNPTNGWLWGIGPVIQIPTISNKSLGSNVWGGGPTGVLVYMKGPWVAGVLANNVWSFGGTSGRGGTRYNTFLTQPFVELQFWRGLVCRHLADHHRELAGGRQQRLDAAGGRRHRPRREDRRQAAGQSSLSALTTTRSGPNSARPGSCEPRSP